MNAERNFEDRPEGFRIDLRVGDAEASLDALSEQLSQDQYYDFVFIDAGKSHYKEFFDKASKLCKPGATIICDNILMKAYIVDKAYEPGRRHRTSVKRMQEFLNYINERDDLTVSLLSCGDGLAVIKLND
jgi:predicted O-methyltransferase YrrM